MGLKADPRLPETKVLSGQLISINILHIRTWGMTAPFVLQEVQHLKPSLSLFTGSGRDPCAATNRAGAAPARHCTQRPCQVLQGVFFTIHSIRSRCAIDVHKRNPIAQSFHAILSRNPTSQSYRAIISFLSSLLLLQ